MASSTSLSRLSDEERRAGVIAASAGNHAQAVAYCAALEGIDALLVMWKTASPAKIAATRGYGAEVDLEAESPAVVFDRLEELRAKTGRTFIHPFDGPHTIAGQGTVGLEIAEDVPGVDVVVIPIGGGGLIAGIATALPDVRVVGVEPRISNALTAALAAGKPVPVDARSIADGLNAPFAGELPLRIAQERGIEVVMVEEEEIEAAMRFLYERAKLALRAGRSGRRRSTHERQSSRRRGRNRRLRRHGRQRRRPDRRCYPGPAMKPDIHPDYVVATVQCSCGNTFETRSTKPEMHVEICSNCHPFYTGKQKLVDTGGRVERFQRRLERAGGARRG